MNCVLNLYELGMQGLLQFTKLCASIYNHESQ